MIRAIVNTNKGQKEKVFLNESEMNRMIKLNDWKLERIVYKNITKNGFIV